MQFCQSTVTAAATDILEQRLMGFRCVFKRKEGYPGTKKFGVRFDEVSLCCTGRTSLKGCVDLARGGGHSEDASIGVKWMKQRGDKILY
jgi:hypothetical protein